MKKYLVVSACGFSRNEFEVCVERISYAFDLDYDCVVVECSDKGAIISVLDSVLSGNKVGLFFYIEGFLNGISPLDLVEVKIEVFEDTVIAQRFFDNSVNGV
jgi:hypothetical protein